MATLALGLAVASLAHDAGACGGTFCDSPPPGQAAMPVDQSGENILFVLADGHVEAHVQIQYTGDPARFAWLVPVPAIPELYVGSQQLFTNLLNGTVPSFSLQYSADLCSGGGRVSSPGCGFGMAASDSSGAAFNGQGAAHSDARSDVVVSREAVGAFEVTVLQPKTASEITAWLDANGFLQAADAPPILQDYIDRGHVFAAVKLSPGAGVNEIHPLVIRYPGTEPCIPLKLTAIAATEDMGVRAFFLGDRRVVPTTYRQVTLNPARLDWVGLGANYTSVVSRAVDEAGADGHGFVPEYAGVSTVVSPKGILGAAWSAAPFRSVPPERAIDLLEGQGLVSCSGVGCTALHPLVLPIVRKYLPAPPGMTERQFYGCLTCNAAKIDKAAWDGDRFAGELDERVIQPGLHAAELLRTSPYVTRLFTTISPYEMTEDPEFAPAPLSEPPVSAKLSANRNLTCGGDTAIEIPGRPALALGAGQSPRFSTAMPYALAVEEFDATGKRTPLYDNAKAIDHEIASWNTAQGYPHPAPRAQPSGGCVLGGGVAAPTDALAAAVALSVLRRIRRRSRGRG
jgi:hypothetical protein